MTMSTKKCTKCGEEKGLDEYYKRNVNGDKVAYAQCKVCELIRDKAFNKTDARKAWRKLYRKSRYKKDKEKNFARSEINKAIIRGDIERPGECSRCRSTNTIHGHHNDYSKPLDVIWLCERCHKAEHYGTERLTMNE